MTGEKMKVTMTSLLSGKTRTRDIPITQEQLASWKAGEAIQDAMPNLEPADREFLMTGITADEWDKTFPEEDYDDLFE